jgi:hypothetical protein
MEATRGGVGRADQLRQAHRRVNEWYGEAVRNAHEGGGHVPELCNYILRGGIYLHI